MAISLEKFKNKLDQVGIPVAYRTFKVNTPLPLPCLIYYEESNLAFSADNERYYGVSHLVVELYTEKKQPLLESQLEAVLGKISVFDKVEAYIPEENMLMITYEMEEL